MMAGFNKALGRKGAAAVIGDSTFFHSGITALIDAYYNEAPGLVMVLDNRTTAMTGHQGHPGTGVRPDGSEGPSVDIGKLCAGIGVRCATVDARDYGALDAAIKAEVDAPGLGVIVAPARRACSSSAGRRARSSSTRSAATSAACASTSAARRSPPARRPCEITDACTGCGLCVEVCRRGA